MSTEGKEPRLDAAAKAAIGLAVFVVAAFAAFALLLRN